MGKKKNYSQLSLDDFSDDDSDDGGGYRDNFNGEGNEADEYIRNQQVCASYFTPQYPQTTKIDPRYHGERVDGVPTQT